ncbi:hypothetical protein NEOC65_001196 [Neochlamydia sp. AcF65]|nr:hypothetical protein [Neochlamydia sp. AcF65]MBS4170194.1 hypothetical protein [Neochlamydia sp. AcF95]
MKAFVKLNIYLLNLKIGLKEFKNHKKPFAALSI